MLAQDVVHCATHARANMPKHVALGIAVRHMTRSKELITMLSRMGHFSSYDDVQAMDTCIANEIIAKSDIFGVVLPSNISTGVFVQVAGDNNDIHEDTIDGKRTTHATTRVLFQRGQLGPAPKPKVYADQTKRKRTIESMGPCQSIRQYSAHGKRPADTCFSGRTRDEWFKCNECLAFGSLQDGSCLGIGKDDTNVLTMVIRLNFLCVFFLQKRHRSSLWENMKYR